MRVWVTRTEPGASRMAAALEREGIACLVAPVLKIVPTGHPLPGGSYDLAVFVSEHAAARAATERGDWTADAIVGIGEPAVAALTELCPRSRIAVATSADCVLRVLDRRSAPPRRTLVAKGEGGRGTLQSHLRQAGGLVVEWDAYRRVAAAPRVLPEAVDAIVCSSGEGVRAAARVWFAHQGSADGRVFVPSRRSEAIAREAGFRAVYVTDGAAPKAVVAAIHASKERNV